MRIVEHLESFLKEIDAKKSEMARLSRKAS